MTEPDNLILQHLRAIRDTQAEHTERFGLIEGRITALEQHMTAVHLDDHATRQQLDSIMVRLGRIETRLGLIETVEP
jgi:hypothetical protein